MQDNNDQVNTKLKLVSQPEGFEFRDKRSDKTNKASDWTPFDALYDVQQKMLEQNTKAVVISWFAEDEEGELRCYVRFSGEVSFKLRLLMEALGREMGWNAK